MRRTVTGARLRVLAGLFGALLLADLVRRTGASALLESVAALGWGLILVLALGGVSHLVKTWAWRITLLDDRHQVSFRRMLGLRLSSEAVGQFGVLGQVSGETLRVSLMSPTVPLASGIASVALDRALFVLTAALVSAVGLIAMLAVLPLPPNLSRYAGLSAFLLLGVILVTALAAHRRWPVFSSSTRLLSRVPHFSGWMERKQSLIHSIESKLFDFYHQTPRAFWASFGLNLACHLAAVLEVFLILWLMGAKIRFVAALATEAWTKMVNILGLFNPGNIGTYEGGTILVAKMLGLSGAAGLTLGLTRRFRAICWAAVGGLCLAILSRSTKRSNFEGTQSDLHAPRNQTGPAETQDKNEAAGRGHVAVILANNQEGEDSFESWLPRVGALPVLLRVILGARKAGATRIVVAVDQVTGPEVQRELQSTRRLPKSVEWIQLGSGEVSLASLLGQVAGETSGSLVVIAGDRTYHPSLHRRASEWSEESGALALTSVGQPVGILAISRDVAADLAKHSPPNITSIEDLHAWLSSICTVECEPVQEDMWQRISNEQDRLSAEQKLDRWLVKPTDGIFARLNRRVSIPISRQIIRFPITPNMVSLFTLGVSLSSGVFFACGGYWNMLLGAFLSVFASILDGSDGEVARLKLQESAFGCWLETVCDYLYYLFIFGGMTIGLLRSSGMRVYLVWGGLLFFGAVLSFLVTGLQRHRLATDRPEQLLQIWQTQASSRQSNPFLYLGRHTEFIIRRCFLPYPLLVFAIFNLTQVGLILSALGANVVWPIALYSYCTFAAVRTPKVISPPATA
ncbi:MAG: lysylphosphatidylglycerol synthase domain-containing protein [Bryobacteraceae bacterium]